MVRSCFLPLAAAVLLVPAGACDDREAPDPDPDPADSAAAESATVRYERAFAFTTTGRDSAIVVPFLFSTRARAGEVEREIEGWIGRDGAWERFVHRSAGGPAGAPVWRILPDGPVRLVVGEGDAIESVIYDQPPRRLDLDLGSGLVEWPGPRGGAYRLDEATLRLGDREIPGIALDLSRSWEAPGDRGDWAFLVSGDSLQVVLHAPGGADSDAPDSDARDASVALVRVDFRNLRWPEVDVTWSEERPFDPARRTVPSAWRVSSETGEIEGELRAESAQISAGEGEGPVLPVRALFGVQGSLRVQGAEYPVRGLVRHRQE